MLGHFMHCFSLNEIVDALVIRENEISRTRGMTAPKRNRLSNANRTRDPHLAEELYLLNALWTSSKHLFNFRETMANLAFGSGCVNDVVIHLATSEMPFGGIGESGMGTYHGKEGFLAFSHLKSIVEKQTWLDLPMRYQPFKPALFWKLLKLFLH